MKNPKYLEIRDSMTFIPALAFELDGDDSWLAHRAGFTAGETYIMLMRLGGSQDLEVNYNPHAWQRARTMPVAHDWLRENWSEVKDGDLIDVQVILGETNKPVETEQGRWW